jgi:hypothetical protein
MNFEQYLFVVAMRSKWIFRIACMINLLTTLLFLRNELLVPDATMQYQFLGLSSGASLAWWLVVLTASILIVLVTGSYLLYTDRSSSDGEDHRAPMATH